MSEHSEPTSSAENRPAPVVPDLQALAQQLVASASDQGVDLTGENGMLTALTKQVLQMILWIACGWQGE